MLKMSLEQIVKNALGDGVINLIYDRDRSMVLIKKRLDLFRNEITQMLLYKALPRNIKEPADYNNIDSISDIYNLLGELDAYIGNVVDYTKQSLFNLKYINTMDKKDQLDIKAFYKYQLIDVFTQLKLMLTLEFVNHDIIQLELNKVIDNFTLPVGSLPIYESNNMIVLSDQNNDSKDFELKFLKSRKKRSVMVVGYSGCISFEKDGGIIVNNSNLNTIVLHYVEDGKTYNMGILYNWDKESLAYNMLLNHNTYPLNKIANKKDMLEHLKNIVEKSIATNINFITITKDMIKVYFEPLDINVELSSKDQSGNELVTCIGSRFGAPSKETRKAINNTFNKSLPVCVDIVAIADYNIQIEIAKIWYDNNTTNLVNFSPLIEIYPIIDGISKDCKVSNHTIYQNICKAAETVVGYMVGKYYDKLPEELIISKDDLIKLDTEYIEMFMPPKDESESPVVEGKFIHIPIFISNMENNYNIGYVLLHEDNSGFHLIIQPLSYPLSRCGIKISDVALKGVMERLNKYIYTHCKLSKHPESIQIPLSIVNDILCIGE